MCWFAHDFEAAREEAYEAYWDHRDEARELGSWAVVKVDRMANGRGD